MPDNVSGCTAMIDMSFDYVQLDPKARALQHFDQRIDAKKLDPAAHQVGHSGLINAKFVGGLSLS